MPDRDVYVCTSQHVDGETTVRAVFATLPPAIAWLEAQRAHLAASDPTDVDVDGEDGASFSTAEYTYTAEWWPVSEAHPPDRASGGRGGISVPRASGGRPDA